MPTDLHAIEEKWQEHWRREGVGTFDPADTRREVYSFDVPPPYASGALHCGHAVHYTHQDFMARYQRMRGKNVFFPLCFDVNGIPIEERVERARGITRKDIGRQEFIEICSRFADDNIVNMTKQFRRLGHSADDTIGYRTDSREYRRVTQISFIEMYKAGHIYKGAFPVNWCPRCMTAMADAEVEHKARETDLNFLKFHLTKEHPELEGKENVGRDDKGQYLEIATTRPELLGVCQVVAMHPDDERARVLEGEEINVPVFDKKVRIITDDTVDKDFGSGALMVCTIGDKEDLNKVFQHKLPMEIAIEGDGTMNAFAGPYAGLQITEAREKAKEDLERLGLRVRHHKTEGNVGSCWRCKTAVEFVQTPQWFLRLLDQKENVLKTAAEQEWFPEFMKIRLRDWVESLEWDWVLSRQRYFATPIPVWECTTPDCDGVVVATEEQAYVDPTVDAPPVDKCPECGGALAGCEDVFDTWMDSSISPLYNSYWKREDPGGRDLHGRLYPMTVRPQSHDIIRTWAFYTILRCTMLKGKTPWHKVMMGGFILDPKGHPMHKSVGNVIDPLDVIQEYGAEALRYYATTCALGEDNAVRYQDFVRGKKFANKFLNIQTFVGKILGGKRPQPLAELPLTPSDQWLLAELAATIEKVTESLDRFEYSPAMKAIESFVWHTLADNYIELVKSRAYGDGPDAEAARSVLYTAGLAATKLAAPFLPHIAEESFHEVYAKHEVRDDDEQHIPRSVHLTGWPRAPEYHAEGVAAGRFVKDVVATVRNWKSDNGMALNAPLALLRVVAHDEAPRVEKAIVDLKGATGAIDVEVVATTEGLIESPVALKPVHSKIGPTFKQQAKEVVAALAELDPAEAGERLASGKGLILSTGAGELEIAGDMVEVVTGYSLAGEEVEVLDVPGGIIAVRKE
ncbi:MAG: valine--tRNA ligase [Euryarchaeota archaeon]|nr:valine--tRNA ligase [Euryarchaeota archaeon]